MFTFKHTKICSMVLLLILSMCVCLFCAGCSTKTDPASAAEIGTVDGSDLTAGTFDDSELLGFLGDYSYDSPIIAMVIEQMEGEAFYGVQYREVLDLNGIVTQNDIPVCLYFYTTLSNDCSSVTAWVEDMAQAYDGKVLFVSVNAMECQDIVSAYQIEYLPEFVLISNGARISTFEGYNYEAWTASDVMYWLSENGIN